MEQTKLMRLIVQVLESLEIPYMITGSHASAYYGEPRFTMDIDIVADLKEEQIDGFITFFQSDEFYCDKETIRTEIKRRGQFNIIHSTSGLKIDIILTKETTFSKTEFSRRKRESLFIDKKANFTTPEDVIIKKMEFYKEGGSEKHLRDITGILKISGDVLDMNYIAQWADRLGIRVIWDAVLRRLKE
ncbi:hypothetical protein KsCSTR_27340 [Candidatus Kuenenia stuttgartiensis]|uniref:Nucleotidyltransferase n=1 Tax=Kuenenia stuttgartiensis TaxID=174633 RepID=Q1Q0L3_KUEST|nr:MULTISPECIES: hypothetical protein [Kuenenia]MBE7546151.1 hypothetical protein [Planctomycetia bacterium]MBW7942814.1 hypothetical protein [Candidatus Kuenenia stuttgartiensis]MBZ0190659.1 hypothetical protein [Candidatus Kuenenia stuttgartiensis]MCF6152570.1 hypothetical protein [Candidatus Kuenenia stuttgartiensis]MCL4727446.1 hypothetical protein [Candidatus Kuenenia stuttgartiensis]